MVKEMEIFVVLGSSNPHVPHVPMPEMNGSSYGPAFHLT